MAGLIAVELNDAGIVVARASADGAARIEGEPSPGFAQLQDGKVLLGEEAALRYRIAPLHAQNRFWQALGLEPLPWTARGIATAADLAHAHLSTVLASAVTDGAGELVLAVPPGYTREQLGLLVGIANECGGVVRGLVDLGLAACSTEPPVPHLLHLDLQLHQAMATLVDAVRAESVLRRSRYELLPGAGTLAFQQAIAAIIATTFVRETRFDPLHEASTEQRLYDRLPGWLDALTRADQVPVEIEFGTMSNRITLERAQVVQAVETLGGDVLRLVQAARPAGTPLRVCVSPRVAAVPGLVDRLKTLRDCTIVLLPTGAAALGALQAAAHIVRPPEAIALVHRLPLSGAVETAPGATASLDHVASDQVPTHVLFRGRAWPVTVVPLAIGWSVTGAPRSLGLPAGIAGVSRSHCTLRQLGGQVVVEDHSTYGTFVNDERVGGRVALRVGDLLRLGAPGVTLELIRVLADHAEIP
jgi:hypothetical protein